MRLVEMRGIRKAFGPVVALDGVDLQIDAGEIVGIVGDNAAGKSTLMKILTGAYQPDSGQIFMDLGMSVPYPGGGRASVCEYVEFCSPEDSRAHGIEMVYQDLALVGCLDVAANVYLGREVVRWRLGPIKVLDKGAMAQETRKLLYNLGISVGNYDEVIENLSGGQRQAVAIARAASFGARLVILDEPTAALSINAIKLVHELIRRLKEQGTAVILISHRIDDVLDVCDSAVVLYQGTKILEIDLHRNDRAWNREWMIRAMEGKPSED